MGPEDAGTRVGCSHPDILESRLASITRSTARRYDSRVGHRATNSSDGAVDVLYKL
jgi:hypothetical protein